MKKLFLKTMLLLCALVVGSSSLWAADVTIASFTSSSHEGWTINGSPTLSNGYYQLTASSISIVSPNIDWSAYNNIKIKVKARKYGGPSDSQLVIYVSQGETDLTTFSPTSTSLSYYGPTTITPTSGAITICCKDASNNKGSGVSEIIITGEEKEVEKTDPTITFNNGSVRAGKTLDLSTLFTSNSTGAVTYSITSGDNYASISGNILTGIAEGEVTVRASQAASLTYNAKTADATITVTAAKVLSSIAVTTPPTKTAYALGEYFDPTGMVVTATYGDASNDDVTALCTFTPSTTTALTTKDSEIEISYTENSITKTTTQAITILDYATLPFSYDNGKNNLPLGLTADGLGSDYSSSPKLKFDSTGDNVVLKIGTYPGTLTYSIKGNSFSGGTFKVQASANGTDYTDLKTYTSLPTSAKSETINNIDKNVRYIKWVYTNKSEGNVALGNIQLTAGEGKDPADLAFAIPSYKIAINYNNFPTPILTNPHGLTVTYSSNNENIAYPEENSGEMLIGDEVGTATITATFAGNDLYRAGTATYTITTYDPNANDGSEAKPYTVTEALALINTLGSSSSSPVYVKGKVSTGLSNIDETNGTANYYISVDGTTTNELECYKGLNLGQTKFTTTSDLSVGDEVVVFGSLKMYNTTPEFNQSNFITQYKHGSEPEVKSLEVKAAEYRTYVASANLVVPTGVKAYIATGESETTLTLKSVAKIKKDSPVILNASEGYYSFEITDEAVDYGTDTNLLQISDGTVTNGVFVLAKINDQVGFYKWAGGALSPGKVYVEAPSSAAREFLGFEVENDVTGINEVKGEKKVVDGIFDLQGRKVVTPSKGLYIMNGKKVVIK